MSNAKKRITSIAILSVFAMFSLVVPVVVLAQAVQLGITGVGTNFPADSQGQNNWYVLWGTTIGDLSPDNCVASTDEGSKPQQWKGPLMYATIAETFFMPDAGVAALKYSVAQSGSLNIKFSYAFSNTAGGNGVEMGVMINGDKVHSKTINAEPAVNKGEYVSTMHFNAGDELVFYCDSINQDGGWDSATYSIGLTQTDTQSDLSVDSITITGLPSTDVYLGEVGSPAAVILPESAANSAVTWTSGNTNAVKINSETGVWEAVGIGAAKITAAADGKSSNATINVIANITPVTILKSWDFAKNFPTDKQGQNDFYILWGTTIENMSQNNCSPSTDEPSDAPQQWKGKTTYATISQTFMMPGEGVIGTKWVAPETGVYQMEFKWNLSQGSKTQIDPLSTTFDGFQMGILGDNGSKLYSKDASYADDSDQKNIIVRLAKGAGLTIYMDKLGVQDFDMADFVISINQIEKEASPVTNDNNISVYVIIFTASLVLLLFIGNKKNIVKNGGKER